MPNWFGRFPGKPNRNSPPNANLMRQDDPRLNQPTRKIPVQYVPPMTLPGWHRIVGSVSNQTYVNEEILNYDDIELYQSDVATLEGHGWLTSRMVNFMAKYLHSTMAYEHKNNAVILYATHVDILKTSFGDELRQNLEDFGSSPRKWNFFLFNNNKDGRPGTHWSLIVFRPNDKFYLFDSKYTSISSDIKNFVKKLSPYFENKEIDEYGCPKMSYCGDCGVYMVDVSKMVVENQIFRILILISMVAEFGGRIKSKS